MNMKLADVATLIESIHDSKPVTGLTHTFYRYPARFSSRFAEAAIALFTKPGEIVYDPFMGGGTTLVEAFRAGRKSVGTDLNSLAVFVSKTKTTLFTDRDISSIKRWVEQAQSSLKLTRKSHRPTDWISQGYQRNISGRTTWPIRKTIEFALNSLDKLQNGRQRDFVRCLLLKTTQWAVDCRKCHPSAREFRMQLLSHCEEMLEGTLALRDKVGSAEPTLSPCDGTAPVCLHL